MLIAGFLGRMGIYHPYDCRRGWGTGYATEGAALLRDWMFETHRPRRLVSHIVAEHLASAQVARKLGARFEGTTERGGVALGVWVHVPATYATGVAACQVPARPSNLVPNPSRCSHGG